KGQSRSGRKYRSRLSATTVFTALSCHQAAWRPRSILDPTHVFPKRMPGFASGVPSTEHMLTGISWAIYGHWDERWNADPSKIRTDVFYLLRTKLANNFEYQIWRRLAAHHPLNQDSGRPLWQTRGPTVTRMSSTSADGAVWSRGNFSTGWPSLNRLAGSTSAAAPVRLRK